MLRSRARVVQLEYVRVEFQTSNLDIIWYYAQSSTCVFRADVNYAEINFCQNSSVEGDLVFPLLSGNLVFPLLSTRLDIFCFETSFLRKWFQTVKIQPLTSPRL